MEIAATGLPGLGALPGGTTSAEGDGAFAEVLGTVGADAPVAGDPKLALAPAVSATGAKTPLLASAAMVQALPVNAESLVVLPETGPLATGEALPDPAVASPAETALPVPAPAAPTTPAPAVSALALAAPKGGPKAPGTPAQGEPLELIPAPAVEGEKAASPAIATDTALEIVAETIGKDVPAAETEVPKAEAVADAMVTPQLPLDMAKAQAVAQPVPTDVAQTATSKPDEASEISLGSQPTLAEAGAETASASDGPAEPASESFARMVPNAASDRAQPQPAGATALPAHASQQLASHTAAASVPAAPAETHPTMSFRADKAAREMGLEIGRHVTAGGGDELVIRLDPAELGRINIRLSVNEQGQLRAVVGADAPSVIEAIRNDIPELHRALEQAGVRTDSQSFRFDRGGGDTGGQWQQRYQQQHANTRHGDAGHFACAEDEPAYRPMATNGRVNMMA